MTRFARYTWLLLAYNLVVILWGAFVRATGSGAGCGSHWPSCNGEIIPRAPQVETMIEFTHRLTSGIVLILVIVLVVWAWRMFPRHHPVRLGAGLTLFFTITEGLLGAGLVLFELVADNASGARVISMALHLVNTFLLLAVLTLTVWWASNSGTIRLRDQGVTGWLLAIAMVVMLFLGVSGAVTALGDTLFPAESLAEGLQQKFSPTAHFLVRLRIYHPVIAILTGAYLFFMMRMINQQRPEATTIRLTHIVIALFVVQLIAGALNIWLLVPVWMQLVHLLLADLIWIALILYSAGILAWQTAPVPYASNTRSSTIAANNSAR